MPKQVYTIPELINSEISRFLRALKYIKAEKLRAQMKKEFIVYLERRERLWMEYESRVEFALIQGQ